MRRREYLKTGIVSVGTLGVAGCTGGQQQSGGGNGSGGQQQSGGGNGSGGQQQTNLILSTAGESTASHASGVGVSQVVNDNSDWLELSPRPSPGTSANVRLVDQEEAALGIGSSIDMLYAFEGREPYSSPKVEKIMTQTFPLFITDTFIFKRNTSEYEDVNTVQDIPEGASVTWGQRANPSFKVITTMLEQFGISNDKFDVVNVDLGNYATAYNEGRADFFGTFSINQSTLPGYIQELDSVGDLRLVEWPERLDQQFLNEAGLPFVETTISSDIFQNNLEVNEFTAPAWVYTLMPPGDADPAVTKEITRIVMNNPQSIREFHDVLANVGPEFAKNRTLTSESTPVHPGSVQWHKETGSWNDDWYTLNEVNRPV